MSDKKKRHADDANADLARKLTAVRDVIRVGLFDVTASVGRIESAVCAPSATSASIGELVKSVNELKDNVVDIRVAMEDIAEYQQSDTNFRLTVKVAIAGEEVHTESEDDDNSHPLILYVNHASLDWPMYLVCRRALRVFGKGYHVSKLRGFSRHRGVHLVSDKTLREQCIFVGDTIYVTLEKDDE